MFKCKECGKEFEDWHALGGHMRTHRASGAIAVSKEKHAALPPGDMKQKERVSQALGKLSELSSQEAWQIVVNWIIDVHRQLQLKDETIQSYRLRLRDSEAKVDAVQNELKKLQGALGE